MGRVCGHTSGHRHTRSCLLLWLASGFSPRVSGLRRRWLGRGEGSLWEEDGGAGGEVRAPCTRTNVPQRENSKSDQAASPCGRGVRPCCLSVVHCLSVDTSTAYSSCPGVVKARTPPLTLSEPQPNGSAPRAMPLEYLALTPFKGSMAGAGFPAGAGGRGQP